MCDMNSFQLVHLEDEVKTLPTNCAIASPERFPRLLACGKQARLAGKSGGQHS